LIKANGSASLRATWNAYAGPRRGGRLDELHVAKACSRIAALAAALSGCTKPAPGDGDDHIASLQRRVRQSMLLVAEHQVL
jgi:hypothetical protein